MKNSPRKKKNGKTSVIAFRVSMTEKAEIIDLAKARRLTVAEYLREVGCGAWAPLQTGITEAEFRFQVIATERLRQAVLLLLECALDLPDQEAKDTIIDTVSQVEEMVEHYGEQRPFSKPQPERNAEASQ